MGTSLELMTAEDLLQIPDDGYCYELINGDLIKMSPSGFQHGRIAVDITT